MLDCAFGAVERFEIRGIKWRQKRLNAREKKNVSQSICEWAWKGCRKNRFST